MPIKNERPLLLPTRGSSTVYDDSVTLLIPSHDFSEHNASVRLATPESLKLPEKSRALFGRSSSSRFADRALPSPPLSRSPTTKNILSPRVSVYDEEAATLHSRSSSETCYKSFDSSPSTGGYGDVAGGMPKVSGLPAYDTPKAKSMKMHKLKEPSLEAQWNDIVAEKQNRFRDCCCCVFSYCIVVFITLGIIVTALSFILRPISPTVEVLNLNVSNFKVFTPGVNLDEVVIEAGLQCVVRITNPNRFATIHHSGLTLTLDYGVRTLASVSVPGFRQSHKNSTDLLIRVPETVVELKNRLIVSNFMREVSEANVGLELRGGAEGHYKLSGMKVKDLDIPIFCKVNVKPQTKTTLAEVISSSCYTST